MGVSWAQSSRNASFKSEPEPWAYLCIVLATGLNKYSFFCPNKPIYTALTQTAMSDGDYSQDQVLHKKRRIQNSCDHCKKRKSKIRNIGCIWWADSEISVKCGWQVSVILVVLTVVCIPGDSATRPGNICSSCLAFKTECTHLFASAKKVDASMSVFEFLCWIIL